MVRVGSWVGCVLLCLCFAGPVRAEISFAEKFSDTEYARTKEAVQRAMEIFPDLKELATDKGLRISITRNANVYDALALFGNSRGFTAPQQPEGEDLPFGAHYRNRFDLKDVRIVIADVLYTTAYPDAYLDWTVAHELRHALHRYHEHVGRRARRPVSKEEDMLLEEICTYAEIQDGIVTRFRDTRETQTVLDVWMPRSKQSAYIAGLNRYLKYYAGVRASKERTLAELQAQ